MYNLWTLIWLYLAFVPRMESNAHAAQKLYCSFHLTEGRKFWIRYIIMFHRKSNHALWNYVICFCFTLKIYLYLDSNVLKPILNIMLAVGSPPSSMNHTSPFLHLNLSFYLDLKSQYIYMSECCMVIIERWEFCILYQ